MIGLPLLLESREHAQICLDSSSPPTVSLDLMTTNRDGKDEDEDDISVDIDVKGEGEKIAGEVNSNDGGTENE